MISTKKTLLANTFFLYLLVFSSYILGLISIPLQTRVLGPVYFGRVGFSYSFISYFVLFIDFGFILFATGEVSKHRDDIIEVSKIVISVTILKIIFIILSFISLSILTVSFVKLREDYLLHLIVLLSASVRSLLPDFLYRGIEKMHTITIRFVCIQALSVILMFIFLRNKEDYLLIPLFTLTGNLIAVIWNYWHAVKIVGIKIIKIQTKHVKETFKNAASFFYSRIASTVYTSTNMFLLGLFYPSGSNYIGFYNSADKLISTAKSGFSPIADSLYPYMMRHKDFKFIYKILITIMPPVIIGTVSIIFFSEKICVIFFGEDYRAAGGILRILAMVIPIIPLTYILGFPTLAPIGLVKYANLSVIVASAFHLAGILILYITEKFNVMSICYLTVVTEFLLFLFRFVVVIKAFKGNHISVNQNTIMENNATIKNAVN